MKTHRALRFVRPFFAALMLSLVAACSILPKPQPDPTRHYVLTGPEAGTVNAALAQGTLKVGVRTVSVAPYLDGKSMIVRRGDNEIDYRDFARWAEPLGVAINRMLVARLHVSPKVARVFPQPFPFDIARDVDVAVTVLRAEGRVRADGTAATSFLCGIEIVRVNERPGAVPEVLAREVFEAPEIPWKEGDYSALALALSESIAKLAKTIADKLPAE
jgi:uncharacterized lipoprotein YmbA